MSLRGASATKQSHEREFSKWKILSLFIVPEIASPGSSSGLKAVARNDKKQLIFHRLFGFVQLKA